MRHLQLAALAAAAAVGLGPALVAGKHLSPECLQVVHDRMVQLNKYSWENGTRAEATLEWDYPSLSIYGVQGGNYFNADALTPDKVPQIMELANNVMDQRPTPTPSTTAAHNSSTSVSPVPTASEQTDDETRKRKRQDAAPSSAPVPTPVPSGASASASHNASATTTHTCDPQPAQQTPGLPAGQPLLQDGAAGDPPSLGISIMLADKATNGGTRDNVSYSDAVTSQLNFLLYHVPRDSNGAISHRTCSVQLWADNIYMVPPFLAYYGATTNNKTLVTEAYNQIKAYREVLQDPDSKLWKHMSVSWEAEDPGLWATGNAWMVAGTARVIATIKSSPWADEMQSEISDLQAWAGEVFDATKPHITSNNLVRNYVTNTSSFEDSSASILFAAAGLRFATLNVTNDHVAMSLKLLDGASNNVNSTGYLTKVTDPLAFTTEGTYSPEGQSFVILAYAAYNDWEKQGKPGNGARASAAAGGLPLVGALALSLLYVLV